MNILATQGIKHIKSLFINDKEDLIMEGSDEIVARLKFIGKIEREEKINTKNMTKQPNNFYTKIIRTLVYPDSRINTIKFLKTVIERSIEIFETNIREKNILYCKDIVKDMKGAQAGLNNLKATYSEDAKFCCDIDILLERIKVWIQNIDSKHKEINI